jgi:hypothetical protein
MKRELKKCVPVDSYEVKKTLKIYIVLRVHGI